MTRTSNERLRDDALARKLKHVLWSNNVTAKMVRLLQAATPEIQAAVLAAIPAKHNVDVSVQSLRRILTGLRERVDRTYAQIFIDLEAELAKFQTDELRFLTQSLEAAIPAEVLTLVPVVQGVPAQLLAATLAQPFQGRLLSEWQEKLGADLVSTITNTVRNGFLRGAPTLEIIGQVATTTAQQNLASVTKSAVGHFAAVARQIMAEDNAAFVKGEQWLSTLDNHTSPMCIIRDRLFYVRKKGGQMVPYKHVVPWGAGPGRLHFCCRSTSTMVTKSLDEMGINPSTVSSATRASMNGQVPASTDFAQWIMKQPIGIQEDAFGVRRAELIRSGQLKVPQLFTDDGRLIPLSELIKQLPG